MRHGRTELRIEAGAGTPATAALAVVEQFHGFSVHSRRGMLRRAPGADWGDPPPPFKAPRSANTQALPAARRAAGAPSPAFDAAALADVLWHGAGVSARSGGIHFRTSPSSGALFATELHVLTLGIDGVPAGLWHFDVPGQPTLLGITDAIHRATSLRAAAVPRAGQAALRRPAGPVAAALQPLPREPSRIQDPLALIAQRRSIRRYADKPVVLTDLAAVLAAMAAPGALLSAALHIDLVAGRAAGLDQDVIGDAAVVFALAIDRSALAADALGAARGYRHAFIEAGLAGERIYLEAGARGLGVCAVGAFYDEEAAALVGSDPAREWIVHFAAMGLPA